jgi:4-hydroxybutyrate CoA-transferase
MNIGIPRDRQPEERRVALTPRGVLQLVQAGHRVYVEEGAGAGCHFPDAEYLAAGGTVVFDEEEPYQRSDLVVKVGSPRGAELARLREGQTLLGFLHLAAAPAETLRTLLDRRITAIGYEVIEDADGRLPVLTAMSEIAGPLSVQVAAHLLESRDGGRGVLLGGAPGIPPAVVVVLGAGTVGTSAARTAIGLGAQVILLDADVERLRRAFEILGRRVTTLVADPPNVERAVGFADALIGAVLIHGRRAPVMVTRAMVSSMKAGSVLVDLSIDQGGCIETSRPTTLTAPTYVAEGVIHYCVPNMTAAVARTAAQALHNAAFPVIQAVAAKGADEALREAPPLARGVYTHGGYLTRPVAPEVAGFPVVPLHEALSRTLLTGSSSVLGPPARPRAAIWEHEFRARQTTAERALEAVRSGQRVYIHPGCAAPLPLMEALSARASELVNVEVVHLLTLGKVGYTLPEMSGHFRHNAMFIGGNVRDAVNDGRADYMPIFLGEIHRLFFEGIMPIDVALIQVSPPDEHGYCSLGVGVDHTLHAARSAQHVIAEVNASMPRTLGDSFLHVSKIDAIVETQRPLPELVLEGGAPVAQAIGRQVAALVPDGATLQMGIGDIPDAVLSNLKGHKDLGVHTEMFSDGVIDLIESGVINGERKTLHPGKVIAGFMLGTKRLFDFVDNNPVIELHPTAYTNDPFIISQNDRMVAINSAIQVDLTGQVCADSIGRRFYSGFGGQTDFIRGAARAKGGVPVIALPSTAMGGSVSRIVLELDAGAGVVTTRADVRWVVTEHGAVNLFGRNVRERAQALISIAHPDFREDLERRARDRRLLA